MGVGPLALLGEGNDGAHSFLLEVAVVSVGVVVSVTAKDLDANVDSVLTGSLEEAIEGLERERVVGLISPWHDGDKGQVMATLAYHQMVVAVPEDIAVPVMIVAPLGRGSSVGSLMLAAIDPLFSTRAGGLPIGGCSCLHDGAIPRCGKVLWISEESLLKRRDDAHPDEKVLEEL